MSHVLHANAMLHWSPSTQVVRTIRRWRCNKHMTSLRRTKKTVPELPVCP